MPDQPLIAVKGLTKKYKVGENDFFALRHVNFALHNGEAIAIMGPSGSGKSTLLHILGCLDRPSEGSYLLEGKDVFNLNDCELSTLRASQIGFVFQSFYLIPQLNVYENIEVPLSYQNPTLSYKEIRNRIETAAERVKLSHRLHHLPSQLSGGETQRAAIARALAIHPRFILADEPTGNLDYETGKSILLLLKELNTQGTSLIIVTHDKNVANYCHDVVTMHDGTLNNSSASRDPRELI